MVLAICPTRQPIRAHDQAKALGNTTLSIAHVRPNALYCLATLTRSDTLVMAGVIARALCPAVSKWMQSSLGSVTQGSKLFMSSLPAVEQAGLPRLPDFAHTPAPYKGPSAEEVLALRKAHLSPCRLLRGAFDVSSGPNPKKRMDPNLTFHCCSAIPTLQEARHDSGGQDAVSLRREGPEIP